MTVEEYIQVAIAKATAAEEDQAYYASVIQSQDYQAGGPFQRAIDARIIGAINEATLHQDIKVALTTLL